MKKTPIVLAVCAALCSPLALSGDLVVSPTLEAGLYQTHIRSPQEALRRQDQVSFAILTTEAEYKSPHYTSQFMHEVSSYVYSNTKDVDSTMQEVSWSNTLNFWQDRLILDQSVHQWREAYDQIGGSFVDDVYSDRAPIKRIDERYGVSYHLPPSLDFDGSVYDRVEINRIEPDKFYVGTAPTHRQKSHLQGWSFGNQTKKQPLLWLWTGDASRENRRDDLRFSQLNSQVQTQMPIYSRWYLSGEGAVQRYKSSTPWNYGGEDRTVDTVTKGAGLSWIKSPETSFVRVTMVHTDDSDRSPEWDWNAEIRWAFADRWSARASKQNRFYGDSYGGEFSYQNENSRFSLMVNEDVRLRYVPVATTLLRGVYICTPGDDPLETLDLTRCELPPSGNISLLPGQVPFFDMSTYYPLATRLSLYRNAGMKWTFNGDRWQHQLWVRSGNDDELTVINRQRADEGFFEGDWRLNSQSFLRGKWRYRALHSRDVPEIQTTERFYSLGYHYEINRQSEWSLALQNINKQTFSDNYDYQDYRIMLSYKHLFGSHHKDRRPLFPNDRE